MFSVTGHFKRVRALDANRVESFTMYLLLSNDDLLLYRENLERSSVEEGKLFLMVGWFGWLDGSKGISVKAFFPKALIEVKPF